MCSSLLSRRAVVAMALASAMGAAVAALSLSRELQIVVTCNKKGCDDEDCGYDDELHNL